MQYQYNNKQSTPLTPSCCKGSPIDSVLIKPANDTKHFECMKILQSSFKTLKVFTIKTKETDIAAQLNRYKK